MRDLQFPSIYKNGRPFGFGVSPNADWKIISSVTLLLIILALGFGLYMFFKAESGIMTENSIGTEEEFSKEKIEELVKYYNNRSLILEDILNKASDPTAND